MTTTINYDDDDNGNDDDDNSDGWDDEEDDNDDDDVGDGHNDDNDDDKDNDDDGNGYCTVNNNVGYIVVALSYTLVSHLHVILVCFKLFTSRVNMLYSFILSTATILVSNSLHCLTIQFKTPVI